MSYHQYEAAKAYWLRNHPHATQAEFEAECKRLARSMGI
jgi:hypothetical protein